MRILVEFDMPGHAQSIGKSHPEVITHCNNGHRDKERSLAGTLFLPSIAGTNAGVEDTSNPPLDPTRHATYRLIWHLIREISRIFPDSYIHLGGDEVDMTCWKVCHIISP